MFRLRCDNSGCVAGFRKPEANGSDLIVCQGVPGLYNQCLDQKRTAAKMTTHGELSKPCHKRAPAVAVRLVATSNLPRASSRAWLSVQVARRSRRGRDSPSLARLHPGTTLSRPGTSSRKCQRHDRCLCSSDDTGKASRPEETCSHDAQKCRARDSRYLPSIKGWTFSQRFAKPSVCRKC